MSAKRTYKAGSEEHTFAQWSEITKVGYKTIKHRERRVVQGLAEYSPEQIVGLKPLPKPNRGCSRPKVYSSTKKSNEKKVFDMASAFLRRGLCRS